MSVHTDKLEALLKQAIADGTAAGVQALVFDKDGVVFSGNEGTHTHPTADGGEGKSFKPNSLIWMASCSKLVLSIMVLKVLEQKLSKTGTTLADLDNHEALVAVMPEFKLGGGHVLTKILEGYGPVDEATGKQTLKLRDTKKGITLRHLLTLTAGLSYYWTSELATQFYRPKEGEPQAVLPFMTAKIQDLLMPAVSEPGETWEYQPASDWLAQFVIKATGKNFPTLLRELILEPLGLDEAEAGCMVPSILSKGKAELAGMSIRNPGGPGVEPKFINIPFGLAAPETEEPPEDMAFFGSAFLYSTLPTYTRILQAALKHDTRLLSEETWRMAERDDTTERGIKHPVPVIAGNMPDLSYPIDRLYEVEDGGDGPGYGANMLQAHVATSKTKTGRSKGSYAWVGLANTYFFVDHDKGLGGIISTQLLPCGDPQFVALRDKFEAIICQGK